VRGRRRVTGAVGATTRYEVLRRDRYTCRFCGVSAPDATLNIDHIVPRALGGRSVASNLQVLCEECNLGKSKAAPEQWLVKETIRRHTEWQRKGKHAEEDDQEDDLSEMYAYQGAYYTLERLSAEQVLGCITHVIARAFPYRPTGSELIISAASIALERYFSDEMAF
jgi:HNH endonuclease